DFFLHALHELFTNAAGQVAPALAELGHRRGDAHAAAGAGAHARVGARRRLRLLLALALSLLLPLLLALLRLSLLVFAVAVFPAAARLAGGLGRRRTLAL